MKKAAIQKGCTVPQKLISPTSALQAAGLTQTIMLDTECGSPENLKTCYRWADFKSQNQTVFSAKSLQENGSRARSIQEKIHGKDANFIKSSPPPSVMSYQGTVTQTHTSCQRSEKTDEHFLWSLRTEGRQDANNPSHTEKNIGNRL